MLLSPFVNINFNIYTINLTLGFRKYFMSNAKFEILLLSCVFTKYNSSERIPLLRNIFHTKNSRDHIREKSNTLLLNLCRILFLKYKLQYSKCRVRV